MKAIILLAVLCAVLFFVNLAWANGCRMIVLPDGTVILMCCDSHGNCTYN